MDFRLDENHKLFIVDTSHNTTLILANEIWDFYFQCSVSDLKRDIANFLVANEPKFLKFCADLKKYQQKREPTDD